MTDETRTAPRDLSERLELAVAVAREAGLLTLDYFNRRGLDVQRKSDGTPVTVADRRAEEHIRERVGAAFPDDAILGEEMPEKIGTSGYRWILDPIDGTKSFIQGVPLYGTLVGVEYGRTCVIGAMVIPALNECIYAARGSGAWHVCGDAEPVPARVSAVSELAESVFCVTSVNAFHQAGRVEAFELLRSTCRLTRGWGDCYGYLLVATGRAELMIDPVLSLWDMAALPPILEEAGGTFTDWTGKPTIYGEEGIGSNGLILEQVLAITRER